MGNKCGGGLGPQTQGPLTTGCAPPLSAAPCPLSPFRIRKPMMEHNGARVPAGFDVTGTRKMSLVFNYCNE
ncbi:hypothetical protein TcasGA2_TC014597 [Tribolium castaneum]|uniref:Uncharacterized protein n=1 Tax=Tribolium castaneum TaxID=7070 RepID=D6WMN9_TRICA|nr:hypothetical protein TcasGA2_TC014597 [Tribolium castaneum]